MPREAGALRELLLDRFRAGAHAPLDDEWFQELALAVFAHQYSCNAAYRAYCDSRRATPADVGRWTSIPAVPTSAFKAVPLICGDPADVKVVFRTSGTTAGRARRGEHYMTDLAPYDAALRAGFAAHLLADGAALPILSLIPSATDAPDSSLSYMADAVLDEFGAAGSDRPMTPAGPDLERLLAALDDAASRGSRVCLLATSLGLVHVLDALAAAGRRFRLPDGSRLMDTGGFKGRARELSRDELYAAVHDRLGIPAKWCVNEYGMTEMGSQFYDAVAGEPAGAGLDVRRYAGPGWVRTRAVDPESMEILPDGETGILRHWDLANVGSVMVLQTEDLGICEGNRFRLLGRAAGAEPRGCSLATEALLDALARG